MDNRPTVEVCFTPNLYPLHMDDADIVVVIDVLRATSAICTAFENGIDKVIPVSTIAEALEYKQQGYLVAAERKGQVVPGFQFGNSPYSYMGKDLNGKTLVITTTNGTKAFHTAKSANQVVIGSLINLDAVSNFLINQKKNVLLLASGWQNKFCLEDTICAGAIADQLINTGDFTSIQDSSIAAKYLYLSARENYLGFLKSSSHRRRLKLLDLNEDIKYCLTPNQTSVVPIRKDNYLVNYKG
jgi:2-phosphosulfolactate phosphatase